MSRTRRFLLAAVASLLLLASATFYWIWFAPCSLGGCAELEDFSHDRMEGSELLDIHRRPFARVEGISRQPIALDSLPPFVPQAFVAIEDRRFYSHGGVDFRRVAGALMRNLVAGRITEGASTITQQLARNLFPNSLPASERNLRRKVVEARVARQIERVLPKDSILELYLNHIYLGNGAYGVGAAASVYFGKRATELTLAEAATLAAVPQSPSRVNPIDDVERVEKRRNLVLDEMMRQGYITADAHRLARAGPVSVHPGGATGGVGLYFVDAVRRELEGIIGDRLYTAGLRIHTTLDPRIQRIVEVELSRQLIAIESGAFGPYTPPGHSGDAYRSAGSPDLQGALVVIDVNTGEVRALVGGRDYRESQFNRATRALRQPGSAFKPFIFAVALERFGSPARLIDNSPLRLRLDGGDVWQPRNIDEDYRSPITMRAALVHSSNTATVRLSREAGLDEAIELAHDLGITNDIANLPAIALGAVEVRPIELIGAYAAFANGGFRVRPHFTRQIVDREGRVVWEADPGREQVLDPEVAFVLTSMLQDAVDHGTGTGVRKAGFFGAAAGKTGTTSGGTDAWFIGYTPGLVAGVWIGLDYPRPIVPDASGEILAAPVWGRVMSRIYENDATPSGWRVPRGVTTARVDAETHSVIARDCPPTGPFYTELFIGTPPRGRGCSPGTLPEPLQAEGRAEPLTVPEAERPRPLEPSAARRKVAEAAPSEANGVVPAMDGSGGEAGSREIAESPPPARESEPAPGSPAEPPLPTQEPERAWSDPPDSSLASPGLAEPAPGYPPLIRVPMNTLELPDSLGIEAAPDSARDALPGE